MATIKDVAKLAGVSHGTVSNVLNRRGVVSPETARKVQEAIAQLGYTPDATARSLKTSRSMNIGVILPNITDPNFAQMFTGIERVLSENGYTTALYSTSEIPAKENLIIDRICQQRMDGVILVTCQPQKPEVFARFDSADIRAVFLEREVKRTEYNYFGYNNYRSFYDATTQALSSGLNCIAVVIGPVEYSSEQQCLAGYADAHTHANQGYNSGHVVETNSNKESAFKATIKLLQTGTPLDLILCSSTLILEGVMKAVSYFEGTLPQTPHIISLSEDTWANASPPQIGRIPRKAILLGELAAETLLENLKAPALFEYVHRVLENVPYRAQPAHATPAVATRASQIPLRVLMLKCSASYATSALLPDFTQRTSIPVDIDTIDEYDAYYDAVAREACADTYDVLHIDLPWFAELASAGCLADLTENIQAHPDVIRDYIPGVLDAYAKYGDSYFGLPYMFGTQLLFYRKDLFEDPELQANFYEQYTSELQPPRTWKEFNVVARFFTQAYNPKSPVKYGTTLGASLSSGAVCEFLPRQWAYGGRMFDINGNVAFNSKETLRALENYAESFQYASKNSANHWWDEQVTEFSQGLAAMMILFVAHATELTNRATSSVVGNIGYAPVPGGHPLLGGWSLGINSRCQRQTEAFQFISWATCQEMAIPYTILGGATPSINLYKSSELLSIYPWLLKAIESLGISRKRDVSKISTGGALTEREYEKILGTAVHQAITKQMTPKAAIQSVTERIQQFLAR
ncbi:hypothetical protein U14_05289 [Candidatus Moduliflexus flocculans]|uniref:HTH lacI-type domain-containing protein n=1 Tax=Candidatus Moduliflexus flocculans TaxID=1499966 RepID=A0A081BRI1_9BACT|nr:hypothetical protein U14_05289 [Candidatus Moduliflexus flocculans]